MWDATNNENYSRLQIVEILDIVKFPLHVDDRQHVPVAGAAGEDHGLRRKFGPLLHEIGVFLPPRTIVAE